MTELPQKFSSTSLRIKNNTIQYFDVFGQFPSFTIFGRDRFTTFIGLFFTIVIVTGLSFYFISELTSMITQSKPSVYQTELQVVETNSYPLQDDNFTLAVSVVNRFSEPLIGINKYYFLNISQCVRTRIKEDAGNIAVKLNCIDFPIEPCNLTHFTTQPAKDFFSRMRFGAMQCINKEYLKSNPPILQGSINSFTYKYISVSLSACKNSTIYDGCASQEEINEVLSVGHYVIYSSDYLSKLDKPGQTFEQIINYQFTSFSIKASKIIVQTYQLMQTQTDEGLLLENLNFQSNIWQKDWREIQDFYNEQYLVYQYIILDYKQKNNIRTYIKLQTVLARIGGFVQIIFFFFAILLKPLIRNFMNLDLANHLYNFAEENPDSIISDQNLIKNNNEIEPQSSPSNEKGNINIMRNAQNNEAKSKLNCSFFGALSLLFGCNSFKQKQFQKARFKILKQIDILYILKKFQEFDLIKKIIFSEEQYQIFKNIAPPTIQVNKICNKNAKMHQDNSNIKSFRNIGININNNVISFSNDQVNLNLLKQFEIRSTKLWKSREVSQLVERNNKIGLSSNEIDENIVVSPQ